MNQCFEYLYFSQTSRAPASLLCRSSYNIFAIIEAGPFSVTGETGSTRPRRGISSSSLDTASAFWVDDHRLNRKDGPSWIVVDARSSFGTGSCSSFSTAGTLSLRPQQVASHLKN